MSGDCSKIDPTVCILKRSVAILVLHEFSQGINFHFTRTTEHQPTGNHHSSTKLFAMMSAANHFDACIRHVRKNSKIFSSTRLANGQLFHFKAWGSDGFITTVIIYAQAHNRTMTLLANAKDL